MIPVGPFFRSGAQKLDAYFHYGRYTVLEMLSNGNQSYDAKAGHLPKSSKPVSWAEMNLHVPERH